MKEKTDLVVRYRNGKCRYSKFGGSAAMVTQVLDLIAAGLRAFAGEYRWHLDGDTYHGYSVVASYSGGRFVESSGKTPGEALRRFHAARVVLRNDHNGDWN